MQASCTRSYSGASPLRSTVWHQQQKHSRGAGKGCFRKASSTRSGVHLTVGSTTSKEPAKNARCMLRSAVPTASSAAVAQERCTLSKQSGHWQHCSSFPSTFLVLRSQNLHTSQHSLGVVLDPGAFASKDASCKAFTRNTELDSVLRRSPLDRTIRSHVFANTYSISKPANDLLS
jgi:hypothetical protein